jgi:ACR3 family arsenite efflux pump ArsB
MSRLNFRKFFGILFTAFIIIIVLAFLLVSISEKTSVATTLILVGIPLVIRYIFYKLAKIWKKIQDELRH